MRADKWSEGLIRTHYKATRPRMSISNAQVWAARPEPPFRQGLPLSFSGRPPPIARQTPAKLRAGSHKAAQLNAHRSHMRLGRLQRGMPSAKPMPQLFPESHCPATTSHVLGPDLFAPQELTFSTLPSAKCLSCPGCSALPGALGLALGVRPWPVLSALPGAFIVVRNVRTARNVQPCPKRLSLS